MSQLTSDFITGDLKTLIYEFTILNGQNNASIPVIGVFIKNICDALIDIGNDIQDKYEIVVYNPFQTIDAWFQTHRLYLRGNQITLENLNKLDELLNMLTAAINYMNTSTYQNNLLAQIPGYVSRLQYAIQYITIYTNGTSDNYGYVNCDSRNTLLYGFNNLKIYGSVN